MAAKRWSYSRGFLVTISQQCCWTLYWPNHIGRLNTQSWFKLNSVGKINKTRTSFFFFFTCQLEFVKLYSTEFFVFTFPTLPENMFFTVDILYQAVYKWILLIFFISFTVSVLHKWANISPFWENRFLPPLGVQLFTQEYIYDSRDVKTHYGISRQSICIMRPGLNTQQDHSKIRLSVTLDPAILCAIVPYIL